MARRRCLRWGQRGTAAVVLLLFSAALPAMAAPVPRTGHPPTLASATIDAQRRLVVTYSAPDGVTYGGTVYLDNNPLNANVSPPNQYGSFMYCNNKSSCLGRFKLAATSDTGPFTFTSEVLDAQKFPTGTYWVQVETTNEDPFPSTRQWETSNVMSVTLGAPSASPTVPPTSVTPNPKPPTTTSPGAAGVELLSVGVDGANRLRASWRTTGDVVVSSVAWVTGPATMSSWMCTGSNALVHMDWLGRGDSGFVPARTTSFTSPAALKAGTYYVQVSGWGGSPPDDKCIGRLHFSNVLSVSVPAKPIPNPSPRPVVPATKPKFTTTLKPRPASPLAVTVTGLPKMGTETQPDGATTLEQVERFPIRIEVHGSAPPALGCPTDPPLITIDGKPFAFKTVKADATGCAFEGTVKGLGPHTASVKIGARRGSAKFTLRDRLIVGLGDSNGSGEGNGPPWVNERCHRTTAAFQTNVAQRLENDDTKTSVTFIHLACSGATVFSGLVGTYRGVIDPGGAALPPQLDALRSLIGKRKPDATMISIGVNDLGFGAVVRFCAKKGDCETQLYPSEQSTETLDRAVATMVASLPRRLDRLAAGLKGMKIDPGTVYMVEYPDPTNDGAEFCSLLAGTFDQDEARWASANIVDPLNSVIANRAKAHGWKVAAGVRADFQPHSYCASDSWFVPLTGGLSNVFGILHPTAPGHAAEAARFHEVISPRLRK